MAEPTPNPEIKYTKIFINDEWVDSVSGKTFPTYNPTNGEKICDIQESDKEDAVKAIRNAREAFKLGSAWRQLDASQRGKLLMKLADLIERDARYLATLESMDSGIPFQKAFGQIYGSAAMLRYYAGWADKVTGQTLPTVGGNLTYTRIEPVGVVAAITPWNAPFFMFACKLAPALATGCTIIIKPAELTSLTALVGAALVKEAGFPPGVVSVVPGYGHTAGAALVDSMDVDKVAFTGSTAVGKLIMEKSGKTNLKRVSLELGGKSPNIIFPDADLDHAAKCAGPRGVFNNSGQVCCALTRTYVHEDVYDAFVEKAAAIALEERKLVGDPLEKKHTYGPQVNETQLTRIQELVQSGKDEGARLVVGGKRIGTKGFFFEPTVFADVTEDMRIGKEEIFGPVQSIFRFKTMEEAIEKANDTSYGLAASVFTKNIDKAITFAHSVNAGVVWINTVLSMSAGGTFGGYKMSGIGREGGSYGIEEYCEVKTIVIQVNPE